MWYLQMLLGDRKVFPRHQIERHATTFSTVRYNLHDLGRIISRTILCGRYDHSMAGTSPATHSCTSIIIFKVCNSCTPQECCTSTILRPSLAKLTNSTHKPTQTNQPTTQPKPNTILALLWMFIGQHKNKAHSAGLEVVKSLMFSSC